MMGRSVYDMVRVIFSLRFPKGGIWIFYSLLGCFVVYILHGIHTLPTISLPVRVRFSEWLVLGGISLSVGIDSVRWIFFNARHIWLFRLRILGLMLALPRHIYAASAGTCGVTNPGACGDNLALEVLVSLQESVWVFINKPLLELARAIEALRLWLVNTVFANAFNELGEQLKDVLWLMAGFALVFFALSFFLQVIVDFRIVDLKRALGYFGIALILYNYGGPLVATTDNVRIAFTDVFADIATRSASTSNDNPLSTVSGATTDEVLSDPSIYATESCSGLQLMRANSAKLMNDYTALFLRATARDIHCPEEREQPQRTTLPTDRGDQSFVAYYMNSEDISRFYNDDGISAEDKDRILSNARVGVSRQAQAVFIAGGAVLEQILHLIFSLALCMSWLAMMVSFLVALFVPTEPLLNSQINGIIQVILRSWYASFGLSICLAIISFAAEKGAGGMVFGLSLLLTFIVLPFMMWKALSLVKSTAVAAARVGGSLPGVVGTVAKGTAMGAVAATAAYRHTGDKNYARGTAAKYIPGMKAVGTIASMKNPQSSFAMGYQSADDDSLGLDWHTRRRQEADMTRRDRAEDHSALASAWKSQRQGNPNGAYQRVDPVTNEVTTTPPEPLTPDLLRKSGRAREHDAPRLLGQGYTIQRVPNDELEAHGLETERPYIYYRSSPSRSSSVSVPPAATSSNTVAAHEDAEIPAGVAPSAGNSAATPTSQPVPTPIQSHGGTYEDAEIPAGVAPSAGNSANTHGKLVDTPRSIAVPQPDTDDDARYNAIYPSILAANNKAGNQRHPSVPQPDTDDDARYNAIYPSILAANNKAGNQEQPMNEQVALSAVLPTAAPASNGGMRSNGRVTMPVSQPLSGFQRDDKQVRSHAHQRRVSRVFKKGTSKQPANQQPHTRTSTPQREGSQRSHLQARRRTKISVLSGRSHVPSQTGVSGSLHESQQQDDAAQQAPVITREESVRTPSPHSSGESQTHKPHRYPRGGDSRGRLHGRARRQSSVRRQENTPKDQRSRAALQHAQEQAQRPSNPVEAKPRLSIQSIQRRTPLTFRKEGTPKRKAEETA